MLLGSKPIALRSFQAGGARHVFAACDRPAVIHAANKKLLFSNVNDDEVWILDQPAVNIISYASTYQAIICPSPIAVIALHLR